MIHRKREPIILLYFLIGLLLSVMAATFTQYGKRIPLSDMTLHIRYDINLDQLFLNGELKNGLKIDKVIQIPDVNNPCELKISVYGKESNFKTGSSFSLCLPVKNDLIVSIQEQDESTVIFEEAYLFPKIMLNIPWKEKTIYSISDRFAAAKLEKGISLCNSVQISQALTETLSYRTAITIMFPVYEWDYPNQDGNAIINIYNFAQQYYARLPDNTVKELSGEMTDTILCYLRVSKAEREYS